MIKLLFRPVVVALALLVSALVYYMNAAVHLPVVLNIDNHLNYAATQYIAKHRKIPVVEAEDQEILFTDIGTTRSLRPPLTYIISAITSVTLEGVIEDRITRQRLGAALLGALTVVAVFVGFWIAFSHLGLALVGTLAIALLPKFVFLASSNNDDIGAIFSVSVLFACVLALLKYRTTIWVLLALSVALGLVLQSKFTAWLTLPWFGLFCLAFLWREKRRVLTLAPMLLIVCIASGGWWLVFNMANYGMGDPTAMRYAVDLQASIGNAEPNREGYWAEGVGLIDLLRNHDDFLGKSYKSLVGYIEWLKLDMGIGSYILYGAIFTIGLFGVAFRQSANLKEVSYIEPVIVLMIVAQCAFYVHHNLLRDVQPQARYILPILMPLVYLFLRQLQTVTPTLLTAKFNDWKLDFQTLASGALIGLLALAHWISFDRFISPSFVPAPYYTSVSQPTRVGLSELTKLATAQGLSYELVDKGLRLQRTSSKIASLTLGEELCGRLHANSLLSMQVSSARKGGFHIRIDHSLRNDYNRVYWRGFPAGQSTALFSIRADNCSGCENFSN